MCRKQGITFGAPWSSQPIAAVFPLTLSSLSPVLGAEQGLQPPCRALPNAETNS